jgi:hypothetical protein
MKNISYNISLKLHLSIDSSAEVEDFMFLPSYYGMRENTSLFVGPIIYNELFFNVITHITNKLYKE